MACRCFDNPQIRVVRVVEVELLARHDVRVGGRVLECVDILLGNEEDLLSSHHADDMDSSFVNDGGLITSEGRKAGYLGVRVAGHSRVLDELGRANSIIEKVCNVVCQN